MYKKNENTNTDISTIRLKIWDKFESGAVVASWTGELITQSCGRWRSKSKIKTKPICHSIHSPAHNITFTEFKQIFYI